MTRQDALIRKGIVDAINLYGVGATIELQLLSGDMRVNIAKLRNEIDRLDIEHGDIGITMEKKRSELQEYCQLCEEYLQADWLKGEQYVAHFFKRIDVCRDYTIRYTLKEDMRQFLAFDEVPKALEGS